jgi:ribose/xylose/arabinose/galactoside ABC-type transport system permease subunit
VKWRPSPNLVPLLATIFVCALLYAGASWHFHDRYFFTPGVFINFFSENAYLGIAAVGLTFVILSGGIDLSVGGMIGLTSIVLATLVERRGVHPAIAMPIVLIAGTLLGTLMGTLIHVFRLAPFFVTLAGMFFARGIALVLNSESISLTHPLFERISRIAIHVGAEEIPFSAIMFLAVVAIGIYLARWTRFGRFCYAIGGNEQSAILMGLPVGRMKIGMYAFSGFCSALAGVVWSLSSWSGNATAATTLELDAIAAVVLGGTLLSGGIGSVVGTLFGVLILGIIQSTITFANLTSQWNKIIVGALLLGFIVMQRVMTRIGAIRAG